MQRVILKCSTAMNGAKLMLFLFRLELGVELWVRYKLGSCLCVGVGLKALGEDVRLWLTKGVVCSEETRG